MYRCATRCACDTHKCRLCLMSLGTPAALSIAGVCSNDAFDSRTGVDTTPEWTSKPESIVALTGLDWKVLLAASFVMLAAGLWTMSEPLLCCGSTLPMWLFGGAIACGYLYQGPPFRCAAGRLLASAPLCNLNARRDRVIRHNRTI